MDAVGLEIWEQVNERRLREAIYSGLLLVS
jgi:hypothetical protein